MNKTEHVTEQISAYLDGALDDAASDIVQEHIATCAQCRTEYTEVRATRQLLRSALTVPPPRAFTLTEEMVGRERWSWGRLLVPRNVPRLWSGSAAAFALVVILFALNISNAGPLESDARTASALLPVLKQAVPVAPGGANYAESTPLAADLKQNSGSVPQATAMSIGSIEGAATATTVVSAMMSVSSTQVADSSRSASGAGLAQSPVAEPTAGSMDHYISPTVASYVSVPESGGPAPDGGRILLFSVEGLLVALGAALALGAVFAARR